MSTYGVTGNDKVVVVTTFRQGQEEEATRLRLACMYLIASLPEESLAEAEELLREIWDFHLGERGESVYGPPKLLGSTKVKVDSVQEMPPLVMS